jgi:hypothetical protein
LRDFYASVCRAWIGTRKYKPFQWEAQGHQVMCGSLSDLKSSLPFGLVDGVNSGQ